MIHQVAYTPCAGRKASDARSHTTVLVLALIVMQWLSLVLTAVAGEEKRNGSSPWARSVVTMEVTGKQYDYYQPWSRSIRGVTKTGLVLGDRQILTTADEMYNRTIVRLQKGGRGRWWIGEVTWIDYHANLALVTTPDADFWEGLKPVVLDRTTPSDGRLQIARWREGNLETRAAEYSQCVVREGELSPINHVVLEVASDILSVGRGEPVIANSRVAGILRAQHDRNCVVIPVSFIQSILEARKKEAYKGLGYFHFVWQRAENPASLAFLKEEGKPRGVIVIDVPNRPDGYEKMLQRRDLILQVDGFDVDTEGDYKDPEFGNVMLENLSTRRKWAGDEVKLQISRDGKPMDVSYRLPRYEFTNSLVPAANYDQEPEYLIVGGLVFQPLTDSFLQSWGSNWRQQCPFRLMYYHDEPVSKDRRALVMLSQVLPDDYNIGYQDQHGLVVEKVNGQRVNRLGDLREALKTPVNGLFHVIEFAPGDSVQRIVLAAGDEERAATTRILKRYGISAEAHLIGGQAGN